MASKDRAGEKPKTAAGRAREHECGALDAPGDRAAAGRRAEHGMRPAHPPGAGGGGGVRQMREGERGQGEPRLKEVLAARREELLDLAVVVVSPLGVGVG